MSISGIYMIRHKDSGKRYIGRSTNVHGRWDLHKRHTEQERDRSPLHRAMRKYGYDAFEWIVLVSAPARLHVLLEEQFMRDMNTMVPFGYNVGGSAGGQPPRALLDAMGAEERENKLAEMKALAAKMHQTLAERRKDPAYDAWYKSRMSEAAKTRWAKRKARIAADPEFAAKANAEWKARAKSAAEAISSRIATDPDFARHINTVRSKAAKKARASDSRTVAAASRRSSN